MIEASSILEVISGFLAVEPAGLVPERELKELVKESFVLIELVVELQEVFGIQLQGRDLEGVHTVQQLVQVVQRASRGEPVDP